MRRLVRLSRLASFRAMHVTWSEHARVLRELAALLSRDPPRARPDAGVTVVLPSYGRPENLAITVRLALDAPEVRSVIVCNDQPCVRIADHVGVSDPRVVLVDRARRAGPVARYLAARASDGDRFVSIDDDLFLPPAALGILAAALAADPSVPHGPYGQRMTRGRFADNLARADGRVDLLNRAYAFTRAHLDTYFELLEALGIDPEDPAMSIGLDDDIVLSFAGASHPRIHDVGPYLDCPSERRRGLARWRRPDAGEVRMELYRRLAALRPRPPLRDPMPPSRVPPSPRSLGWALAHEAVGLGLARRALAARRR